MTLGIMLIRLISKTFDDSNRFIILDFFGLLRIIKILNLDLSLN
jgi:hypothetical protein